MTYVTFHWASMSKKKKVTRRCKLYLPIAKFQTWLGMYNNTFLNGARAQAAKCKQKTKLKRKCEQQVLRACENRVTCKHKVTDNKIKPATQFLVSIAKTFAKQLAYTKQRCTFFHDPKHIPAFVTALSVRPLFLQFISLAFKRDSTTHKKKIKFLKPLPGYLFHFFFIYNP